MRVPAIAACTLTLLVTQNWNQHANADSVKPTNVPEPDASDPSRFAGLSLPTAPAPAIAPPDSFSTLPTANSVETANTSPPAPIANAPTPASQASSAPIQIPVIPIAPTPQEAETPPPPSTAESSVADTSLRPVQESTPIEIPVTPMASTPVPASQQAAQGSQPLPSSRSQTQVYIEGEALPVPGVLPLSFTLPVKTQIVTDASITTNTPITDQAFPHPLPRSPVSSLEELARYREANTVALNTWAEQIQECLQEQPRLVSLKPDGTEVPILFNERQGNVVRNGNGKLVCPV